jgi:acid ceramidase
VKQFILDLDLPAEQRWTEIVTQYKDGLNDVIEQIMKMIGQRGDKVIAELLTMDEARIFNLVGAEYTAEIKGIAAAANASLPWALVMQLAYEVGGVGCTSIVAQNTAGNVFHARNLDFGLFDGYSFQNDTWDLTTKLRNILIEVHVQQGGVTIFNATTFAGFVGLLTGAKAGAFSISVDSRYDDKLDYYLLEWLRGKYVGSELTMFLRDVMTTNNTFAEALATVQNVQLVGPAYIIMGGINAGEGAVVTREATHTVDTWTLANAAAGGAFYVLETNYDRWKPAPFFDDRRIPAQRCLNETGPAVIDLPHLFNVLSAQPVRNQLTTQTVLMQPAVGRYESYAQWCLAPCTPW